MKIKTRTLLSVLGCTFMIVALLSGCGKGAVGDSAADKRAGYGNTSSNIANMGGAAEYKDKVYYQNSEDNLSIYCSDIDGSNPVKLNENQSYFINVLEDCIVYVNGDEDFHIYKMGLDGSNPTCLNQVQSYYVSVAENKIYYSNWSDSNKIYSMNLDGSDNKAINEDIAYYVTVDGGKIYYSNWSDGAKLYSMDFDGGSKLKLTETGCWYAVPEGDWVYYSRWEHIGQDAQNVDEAADKFLCRVKKDGSANDVLVEAPCGDINVYKGKVYYTNWTENKIYSINTDGTEMQKITDSYGVYLNTAGGRLYYVEYDDNSKPSVSNILLESEGK